MFGRPFSRSGGLTGSRREISLLAAWLCIVANPLLAQSSSPPFQQDAFPDGVITIEAEHFHTNTPGSGVGAGISWQLATNSLASGGLAMQALPNNTNSPVVISSGYGAASPRLDYVVNFVKTGTHYIIARGVEPTGDNQADTYHAGLDGAEISTSDIIFGFGSSFRWEYDTSDGPAAFNVPAPGEHTVNVWMREDGFIIDKIVVSKNSNFVPTVHGPKESPQGTNQLEVFDVRSTYITDLTVSNGQLIGTFEPVPGVSEYQVMSEDLLSGSMQQETSAAVSGFSLVLDPSPTSLQFYAMDAVAVNTNVELGANVFTRLAYGPTPEELERVITGGSAIGAEAYIQEQMAPESIVTTIDSDPAVASLRSMIDTQLAELDDLQAWYKFQAIGSERQFLEVLTQFFNNHFVTYWNKSRNFLLDEGETDRVDRRISTTFEFEELQKWQQVLMDPDGNFYDLLKISAESPAMIIFLDTVENLAVQPNENYSREIMELFSMGVDNGYDQDDIEEMSRCWTGWSVKRVHPSDVGNPHASEWTNGIHFIQPTSTTWRYRAGTNEPAANWRDVNYVEGAEWMTAQTSIGFGDNDDNTVLTNMRFNYSTIYMRHPFVVTNVSEVPTLQLRLYFDDGMIAYINSQEVARLFVTPGNKSYNSVSGFSHERAWEAVLITNPASFLVEGTNMLAIHALNSSSGNSDFSSDAAVLVPATWSFVFDPSVHDTSNKVIFAGKKVDARFGVGYAGADYELAIPTRSGTNGIQDGYDIVDHLANLPYTQEYMSVKLCQLLVNDNFNIGYYFNISDLSPEAQLVRDCMTAWDTPASDGRRGNIRAVLNVILSSELFRSQAASSQKIKTPFEYVVSSLRALRGDIGAGAFASDTDGYDLVNPANRMGMQVFQRSAPDGWPEVGGEWIDTGTVNERLRFIQNYMMHPTNALKDIDYGSSSDDNVCFPVALIQAKLPSGDWSDAEAITDYFLGILYPGEGLANLALERAECITLLNTDSGDSTQEPPILPSPSPFNLLSQSSGEYDERIRSLVGLLLANPRFHEQ